MKVVTLLIEIPFTSTDLICTIIYFVTAYWAMQRGKVKNAVAL